MVTSTTQKAKLVLSMRSIPTNPRLSPTLFRRPSLRMPCSTRDTWQFRINTAPHAMATPGRARYVHRANIFWQPAPVVQQFLLVRQETIRLQLPPPRHPLSAPRVQPERSVRQVQPRVLIVRQARFRPRLVRPRHQCA